MVNYNFQAGKLIKDAIREVNVSHRSISMTEVLIGSWSSRIRLFAQLNQEW